MTTREPIKLIADVLQEELDLQPGAILLSDQKYDIPPDPGIRIVLSYVSGSVVSSQSRAEATNTGMQEVQEVLMHYLIQLDVLSADASARTRKEEVIMALRSIFSQKTQEENSFHIARIPSQFQDASSLEETFILKRYTMTIAVTALQRKVKALEEYYDTFQTPEVTVNE